MRLGLAIAVFTISHYAYAQSSDAFEVATIKPSDPDYRAGKYARPQGARFIIRSYTPRDLIAAAYDLSLRAIAGGPGWVDSDHYDVDAKSPVGVAQKAEQQLPLLRELLTERFNLSFHREARDMPVYELTVGRTGAKLQTSLEGTPESLTNIMFPENRVKTPGRGVTMAMFASMLQRGMLDRPVLDRTNLPGKYDFDIEWTRDESLFGGRLPMDANGDTEKPNLFTAIQEQLGLRLVASRGPVEVLIIDRIEKPSAN